MKTKITLESKLKKGDIVENHNNKYEIVKVDDSLYFYKDKDLIKTGYITITTIEHFVDWGYELLTPEWSAEESLREHKKYWFISILESEVKIDWCFWSDDEADNFRLKMGLIVENEEAGRAKIKEIMEK